MKSFFDHMYNQTKIFEVDVRVMPTANKKPLLLGSIVTGKATPVQQWSGGMVTSCSGSQCQITKDGKVFGFVISMSDLLFLDHDLTSKCQRVWLKQFLDAADVVIRLSHFFDCPTISEAFQCFLANQVHDPDVLKNSEEMFALLLLCDYCHFDSLVRPIVVWMNQKKFNLSVAEWDKISKTIRSETNAVLLNVAFST